MPGHYDVLTVGGGPSGAAAAIAGAQQGLRIALVEHKTFPRPHPGETLHPGIEPVLKKLGVWDEFVGLGFIRIPGIWVSWNTPACLHHYGQDATGSWHGYQAWRAQFDHLLLRRAAALGVDVRQPCTALQPVVRGQRATGLVTSHGRLSADFVVDASGPGHWLARRLNIPWRNNSPKFVAWYGYSAACRISDAQLPLLRSTEGGWTWLAQVREDLYHWIRLDLSGENTSRPTPPEELLTHSSPPSCMAANVTWRRPQRLAGPGYLLSGDAAWVLDPACSHGVLKAIMSGMMAAHIVGTILRTPASEAQRLRQYAQWLGAWYAADRQKLRALYAALRPSPEWVLTGTPPAALAASPRSDSGSTM
jgi:flavin-dependent dehydrogenase